MTPKNENDVALTRRKPAVRFCLGPFLYILNAKVIFMATIQDHAKNLDVKVVMITAVVTSLAFVVGLFWNDAIKTAIETLFPSRDEVGMKFFIAIIVTIFVSVVIYIIYRTQRIAERYEKKIKEIALEQKRKLEEKRKKYQRYILGSREYLHMKQK